MVGGEVIGVSYLPDSGVGSVARVLCSEYVTKRGGKRVRDDRNACWIQCRSPQGARQIEVGDWLWWQGNWAMWTPKENHIYDEKDLECGVDYDIRLERIGFSVSANL